MPDRSKKRVRPRYPNELAHQIMLESTGLAPKYELLAEPPKNPVAVSLGRLSGLKGGLDAAVRKMKPELGVAARAPGFLFGFRNDGEIDVVYVDEASAHLDFLSLSDAFAK